MNEILEEAKRGLVDMFRRKFDLAGVRPDHIVHVDVRYSVTFDGSQPRHELRAWVNTCLPEPDNVLGASTDVAAARLTDGVFREWLAARDDVKKDLVGGCR